MTRKICHKVSDQQRVSVGVQYEQYVEEIVRWIRVLVCTVHQGNVSQFPLVTNDIYNFLDVGSGDNFELFY